MRKIKGGYIVAIVYAVLFFVALILILKFEVYSDKKSDKIAFITNGGFDDAGWSAVHYRGISEACKELDVNLLAFPDISETDDSCEKLIEELAGEGVGMIILDGHASYPDDMVDVFAKYSDITFYGPSTYQGVPNMTPYSARLYQARYLSGIIVGMYTQNNKIGFVAADRNSQVCRGINAFTLGIRSVNPEAEVIVAWTDSFDDEQKEKELARALIEKEGVDVITYHQNQPNVIEVAEEYGIASIGYYETLEDVSDLCLTSAVCDWEPVYEDIIRQYLRGEGNTVDFDWLGLRSGVIHLTGYSPLVPAQAKEAVKKAEEKIISGADVFTGLIYDNEGNEKCGEGESITDDTLMYNMTWLVEGVREYED